MLDFIMMLLIIFAFVVMIYALGKAGDDNWTDKND